MVQDLLLFVTLWVATGAFIGGVVTPVLAAGKRFNDWLSMVIGVGVGAVGNVILLAPLWAFVSAQKASTDTRLVWQRDAMPVGEVLAGAGTASPQESLQTLAATLRANFWPAPRVHGHSHRLSYVGVFAALAIITAVEVALTYMDLPFPITGPLVALSMSKVLLVAMYFMHLRYDSRWYAGIFMFGVPFAALILTVLALA